MKNATDLVDRTWKHHYPVAKAGSPSSNDEVAAPLLRGLYDWAQDRVERRIVT